MPLNAGDREASEGMARAIFEALDQELRPPLEASLAKPDEEIPPIRDSWRTLAFAVATGVVRHLEREPGHEPEFAESFSSADQDEAFWEWLEGFTGVLGGWAGSGGTVAGLRTELTSFLGANPVPGQLRGVLR